MSLVKVVLKYLCDCPKHSAYLFTSLGGLVIAYKVLSNILKMPECQDKIIFVVSHLEKIPDDMFNKSIEIKDGKVFL